MSARNDYRIERNDVSGLYRVKRRWLGVFWFVCGTDYKDFEFETPEEAEWAITRALEDEAKRRGRWVRVK
jgi:hypothetical protein